MKWYDDLDKSSLTPPSYVFGPVWTVLYALMAASLFRIVQKGGSMRSILVFFVQLLPNLLWTPLFFTHRRICLSALLIVLTVAASVASVIDFFRVDVVAGWLLLPSIVWSVFALYLNTYICLANR